MQEIGRFFFDKNRENPLTRKKILKNLPHQGDKPWSFLPSKTSVIYWAKAEMAPDKGTLCPSGDGGRWIYNAGICSPYVVVGFSIHSYLIAQNKSNHSI